MKIISSSQNELIKNIVKLNKSGERKKQNLIIVEGFREISLCIKASFGISVLLYCKEVKGFEDSKINRLKDELNGFDKLDEVVEVTESVYSKIAYRESSDGIIALAKPKFLKLKEIKLSDNPLVIVLETIEKPGNLGAILRTADAANVDAVIICDNQTDIYNPNIIRSSLGTIFTNKVVCCSNEEALGWLNDNRIKSFATSLKGKKIYHECDFSEPTAILMGSEAFGLSDFWHNKADEFIKVPMSGKVDSLNVSVTTAIVVFEAKRQRTIDNG